MPIPPGKKNQRNQQSFTSPAQASEKRKKEMAEYIFKKRIEQEKYRASMLGKVQRWGNDTFWEQTVPWKVGEWYNGARNSWELFAEKWYGHEMTRTFKDFRWKMVGFSYENSSANRSRTSDGSIGGTSVGSRDLSIFINFHGVGHPLKPDVSLEEVLRVVQSEKFRQAFEFTEDAKSVLENGTGGMEIIENLATRENYRNAEGDSDSDRIIINNDTLIRESFDGFHGGEDGYEQIIIRDKTGKIDTIKIFRNKSK